MAQVINSRPSDKLTEGEKYTLEKLKRIVPETTYIYLQPTINGVRPDFVLIDAKLGVIVIEVKDWSDCYLETANKKEVIFQNGERSKNPIKQITRYKGIIRNNIEGINEFVDEDGDSIIPINSLIFMTNLTSEKLESLGDVFRDKEVKVYDRTMLRNLDYEVLAECLYANITAQEVDVLRGILLPEIIVPTNKKLAGNSFICIDDFHVLDKEQEDFAKRIPNGHYMVSGLPGSGKTVMLLTRAIHLALLHHDWDILIVTYTNALKNKLSKQLAKKALEMNCSKALLDNIKVCTFHSLCSEVIGQPKTPEGMDKDTYFNYYYPQKAIECLKSGKNTCQYDSILVDEYQDFHVNWFELVKAVCRTQEGTQNLFFAGDRLQRIYDVPWNSYKEIGINIQGRSKLLKKSYRTNSVHMDYALKFLSLDKSCSKEISHFYELDKLEDITSVGEYVELLEGEENIAIKKVLTELVIEKKVPLCDILIITHSQYSAKSLISDLGKEFACMCYFGKEPKESKLHFTTYYSAKGLEAKYCILHSVEKFDTSCKTERKLMYVGMTRASKRLFVHGFDTIGFFEELKHLGKDNQEINANLFVGGQAETTQLTLPIETSDKGNLSLLKRLFNK